MGIRIICQSGATCLFVDCCFSKIAVGVKRYNPHHKPINNTTGIICGAVKLLNLQKRLGLSPFFYCSLFRNFSFSLSVNVDYWLSDSFSHFFLGGGGRWLLCLYSYFDIIIFRILE